MDTRYMSLNGTITNKIQIWKKVLLVVIFIIIGILLFDNPLATDVELENSNSMLIEKIPDQIVENKKEKDLIKTKQCTVPYPKYPLIQYALMIDAGSTGSRIHIYRFNYCNSSPTLENEIFKEIKPGLSSYPDNPEEAANSLDQLLQIAMNEIPKQLQKCTPIAVKATAGLRLLGAEKSELILKEVERKIRKEYPFKLPKENGVILMEGKDEGVYAWITVNFLLNNIGGEKKTDTAAVMDLGGGSTQIVFEPLTVDKLQYPIPESDSEYRVELNYGGINYVLYQHSYLGYGLMEARKSILKGNIKKNGNGYSQDNNNTNNCFPETFSTVIEDADTDSTVTVVGSRNINFESCYDSVNSVLFNKTATCSIKPCSFDGIYQPSISQTFKDNDIYAFSYFYDRTLPFGISLNPTVKDIAELAKKVCRNQHEFTEITKNDDYFCMDLTYLYSLLNYGYEIVNGKKILLAKKINDAETGWCLGATIQMLDNMSKEGTLFTCSKIWNF